MCSIKRSSTSLESEPTLPSHSLPYLEITLAGWHFVFMEKCITCTHCHVTRKQGYCIKSIYPFLLLPIPLKKSLPVHCLYISATSRRHLHRIVAEANLGYFFFTYVGYFYCVLVCFTWNFIVSNNISFYQYSSVYLSNQLLKDVLVASYIPIYN